MADWSKIRLAFLNIVERLYMGGYNWKGLEMQNFEFYEDNKWSISLRDCSIVRRINIINRDYNFLYYLELSVFVILFLRSLNVIFAAYKVPRSKKRNPITISITPIR